jgi:hypothetical protein
MVNEQELKQAYDAVSLNTEKVVDSGFAHEMAKAKLDVKVLEATFDGRIQGKNEGERKAVAMQLFQQDFADVDAKEYEYKVDTKALSLARIHLDMLRDFIRIEELAKK